MGWSGLCVRRSNTRSVRLASRLACSTSSSSALSPRWCEQEQVTRMPPGGSRRRARRLISLYPVVADSRLRRLFAKAGGSSMTMLKGRPAVGVEASQRVAAAGVAGGGAVVDLLVPGGGRFQIAPALREGRRVQHDHAEVAARAGIVGKQLEDVGFLEIDVGDAVGASVGSRGDQRWARTIGGFHALALAGDVQGEAAGGGEAIERLAAAGVAGGGAVVVALIQKDAGLLTVHEVGAQGEPVHLDRDRLGNFAGEDGG